MVRTPNPLTVIGMCSFLYPDTLVQQVSIFGQVVVHESSCSRRYIR